MFRFISLFITILACTQLTLGSNLHGASIHAPTGSVISSGQYGHGALTNAVLSRNIAIPTAPVISSYSTSIVHPNSYPAISSSIPHIGHQQYLSAPLTNQIYSSPLVSGGLYGQNGLHANSYAVQRSYTAPLVASGYSGHGLYSAPIVATGNAYGAQLGQAHSGYISGRHLSGW